jgi:DMSO/TMAO reductase YedYZ molybdopterin-dependent catalytic subunit
MKRRLFLATSMSAALSACGAIGTKLNDNKRVHDVIDSAEQLNNTVIGTHGLAREYSVSDISAVFPIDSLDTPSDALYTALVRNDFRGYRLTVDGMVERPQKLSLAQLTALPQSSQITRHDCVEGWSAIAQWQGVALRDLLTLAGVRPGAQYVVFHTFDRDGNGVPYYESLSLEQAMHPQALMALRQNNAPIHPDHGAPVRLKVPTQLGYKSAKWVRHIEVVASLRSQFGGKGGYWEDQGYEWYAGI